MLKQIIFILKDERSSHIQSAIADIAILDERCRKEGVRVSHMTCDAAEKTLPIDRLPAGGADGTKPARPDTLYLTDDPVTLTRLLAAGYYIIAFVHDGINRAELHMAMYAMSEVAQIDFDSFLKAYQRLAGLPWHILDTPRLCIRETTIDDVDDFFQIYSDTEIAHFLDPLFLDIGEEKAYAADYIRNIYGFYGYGIWTVTLRTSGEVIGRAGISWREGHRRPELGFIIARPHQRQGYAEEALRAILALAKTELELDVIQAIIRPHNIASLNLCRKLGFTDEGTVELDGREHLLLTIDLKCPARGSP